MNYLKDKVVLITGASSGIGAACARKFAAAGAKVCIAARREEKLKKLCSELESGNAVCMYNLTDVTDEDQVKELLNTVTDRFGPPDILVNNAGRGLRSEICSISHKEWKSVIDTNLTGVFLCTKEAACRMIDKNIRGHIITVSSIAGIFGAPRFSAYCASKHGVNGFHKSIKWELRKKVSKYQLYILQESIQSFLIYMSSVPEGIRCSLRMT